LRGLDEGIDKLGPLVTLQLYAIELELRRRQWAGALSRLDLIAAQSERKEQWLARRGEILTLAGRHEQARAAFASALNAIDSLPPHARSLKATSALEQQVRAALARNTGVK
jgi:predicted negative regulator of RcsB-dependent stress response